MERLICWAVLVQTKGRGFWFQPSIKRVIARSSCATLSKLPRRIACWLIRPNQRSTKFSHEALVGVKWRWKRGWAASH